VIDECKVQGSGEIIMKAKTEVLKEEPTKYPTWSGVHSRAGFTAKKPENKPLSYDTASSDF
jgi:hypothetical protein